MSRFITATLSNESVILIRLEFVTLIRGSYCPDRSDKQTTIDCVCKAVGRWFRGSEFPDLPDHLRYRESFREITQGDALVWMQHLGLDLSYHWSLFDLVPLDAPQDGCKNSEAIPPPPKSKVDADDRRKNVKVMIDALSNNQLWSVTPKEIARRTRIPLKTLYAYLRHDTIRKTREHYKRESAGKIPANLDEIGDE